MWICLISPRPRSYFPYCLVNIFFYLEESVFWFLVSQALATARWESHCTILKNNSVAQPIFECYQKKKWANCSEIVLQINLSHHETFCDFIPQLFWAELVNHAKRHITHFALWLMSSLNQDLIIQIHCSSNALPLSGLAPFIGCACPLKNVKAMMKKSYLAGFSVHCISLQLSFPKSQQLLTSKTIKFHYIQFSENEEIDH